MGVADQTGLYRTSVYSYNIHMFKATVCIYYNGIEIHINKCINSRHDHDLLQNK